jgi:hypothetical protein
LVASCISKPSELSRRGIASVVDQQVESRGSPSSAPSFRELAHAGEVGEIEPLHFHFRVGASGHDACGCRLTSWNIPDGEGDVGPVIGELFGRDEADAGVCPRDDRGASGEVGDVGGGPSGSGHAS